MEITINKPALKSYSKEFAKIVCDNVYGDNEKLTGKDIVNLTPSAQINYFILKNLFSKWQREVAKLESPYFDYNSDEVQKGLKELMNKLSHSISIGKEDMLSILSKATFNAIYFIFSPYNFLKNVEFEEEKVTKESLEQMLKYLKENKILIDSVLLKYEQFGFKELNTDDVLKHLMETYNEFKSKLASPSELIKHLSVVLPVDVESLTDGYNPKAEGKDKVVMKEALVETLNDVHKPSQQTTVLDGHQKTKIESIKASIAINQKYIFVNELFDGKNEAYEKAIVQLDECETLAQAEEILQNELAKKHKWNMESKDVQTLTSLVSRKF